VPEVKTLFESLENPKYPPRLDESTRWQGFALPQGAAFSGAVLLPPAAIRITISKCLNKIDDAP
jgi:hypothetical protein